MVVLRVQICWSYDARIWSACGRMEKPQQGHHQIHGRQGCSGSPLRVLDIDVWQRQATKISQDGVVITGLCQLARYHVHLWTLQMV